MKIYTSYFANYRNFTKNQLPIGITRFPPKSWKGINLSELAPSETLLKAFKNHSIDEYMFKIKYQEELDGINVREKLETIANGKDVILCCYEKPNDFCHRHILNDMINGDGELNNA